MSFRVPLLTLATLASILLNAQCSGWQQRVEYDLYIDLNVQDHSFTGTQKLKYFNNSPDTLHNVYYHLFFNAFKPGSMMDVRSRNIEDPDPRIRDRILHLTPAEQGDLRVVSLKQNGATVMTEHVGTILEVALAKPILPGKSCTFEMEYKGQVPLQVRRSGRDNAEGVAYSMTQWYPKMCEYDHEGWHANPYVGREFHGVWGDFDLRISIDKRYTVAGTGYLQNPNKIGHGYEEEGVEVSQPEGEKLLWHFKAPKVHDVAWAADMDFLHKRAKLDNGTELHFFYKNDSALFPTWDRLPELMVGCFHYMNERFGEYPYRQYSFIQGGDGGMEYPMATLLTGKRSFGSLVGTAVHEAVHSWFHSVLAFNESLYPWMDEGFTSYADSRVMGHLFPQHATDPSAGARKSYLHYVGNGKQEPLTTHGDHYLTNGAYGMAAYSKGALFLDQLSYIVGQGKFDACMRELYRQYQFKHPTPLQVKRIFEKASGLELDWYFQHWIGTINTIDYAVSGIEEVGDSTYITLERKGPMMMPVDLAIFGKDDSVQMHYVPLRIMRGGKHNEYNVEMHRHEAWPWTHPTYTLALKGRVKDIERIEIDPSLRMVDVDRTNNVLELKKGQKFKLRR